MTCYYVNVDAPYRHGQRRNVCGYVLWKTRLPRLLDDLRQALAHFGFKLDPSSCQTILECSHPRGLRYGLRVNSAPRMGLFGEMAHPRDGVKKNHEGLGI